MKLVLSALVFACAIALPAFAQQNSSEEAARRADALYHLPRDAARRAFFDVAHPAQLPADSIGLYGRGCLAGGQQMPADGPDWQVMRPSRQRSFAHPLMITYLQDFAIRAKNAGWPGLLIGDMAQARGGPMLTGHASHQLGLEADVWLTPMPAYRLSREQREEMSAIDMVQPDLLNVIEGRFGAAQLSLLRQATLPANVDRIFVNPAIKKAACAAAGNDRTWLHKLRPWSGHTYHFHIALKCPNAHCAPRAPIPAGDGCDLAWWFREDVRFPKPNPNAPPPKVLTVSDMPQACMSVLSAPDQR